MKRIFILSFFTILLTQGLVKAQGPYIFFSDSPDNTFYDWSWGFVSAPSLLERVGEKFPVDTDHHYSGLNSLRLHWTSNPAGDWGMAVAAIGTPWPTWDVTIMDSIQLWLYSEMPLEKLKLPAMYLEDNTNTRSTHQKISDYAADIQQNVWTKISLPVDIFINTSPNVDFTIIKTIFFGQDDSDAEEHTVFLDEIRIISNSAIIDTIPPATPTGLSAKGFDRHIDLKWTPNTEPDLEGYNIYKEESGNFNLVGTVSKDNRYFTDFIGQSGINATYKISAFDNNQNESGFSTTESASTRVLNDEELLDMVQEATFRYFWDYAHPVSGLARERTGSGNTVTIGGSGFGIMAILVGIERGFISRQEGAQRMLQILNFLTTSADRFHGAFSHWLDGETGSVIPFSQFDDGGDLVETAFMVQGLLSAKQYFNLINTTENVIRIYINQIWESVEWDWYRKDPPTNYLYWHWSPNYGWQMNFPLIGWNETMITYLLAIASPTHNIPASLYQDGWASSSSYVNGGTFYGYPLEVGWDYGGPLFFAHYSFLGFDPRNKKDAYTNYAVNNTYHTLINRAYCIDNPGGFAGYSGNTWGLTASDDPFGYSAHAPFNNDNGTITPTAALSSMPYTPVASMEVLKNLYRNYGESLWGIYGFKDAFNPQQNWTATSYLAIDEGPIIVMIENFRTKLLWNKFMANPEIQPMLDAIGFVPDSTTGVQTQSDLSIINFTLNGNYPNPFNPTTTISFNIPATQEINVTIYDVLGREVKTLFNGEVTPGTINLSWDGKSNQNISVGSGVYIYKVVSKNKLLTGKMVLQK
jgi:hypothetical protein